MNHTVTIGTRTFDLTLKVRAGWGGNDENPPEPPTADVLAIHEGEREVDADEFDAHLAASVPDTEAWWAQVTDEADLTQREAAAAAMERSGFCDG
jgi:hypothetical protein